YEALKIKSTLTRAAIPASRSAILRQCFSLSMTQGPAMKKGRPRPSLRPPICMDELFIWRNGSVLLSSVRLRYRLGRDGQGFAPRCEEQLVLVGRGDETGEERVRLEGLGFEFRVELAPEEQRMIRKLIDVYVITFHRVDGEFYTIDGEAI